MNERVAWMTVTALLAGSTAASIATAEDECQCREGGWTGECTGDVRQDGRIVFVTSSSTQCSRVEWAANGKSQIALLSGGELIQEWAGEQGKLAIEVYSCWVCGADGSATSASGDSDERSADGGELTRQGHR